MEPNGTGQQISKPNKLTITNPKEHFVSKYHIKVM